MKVQHDGRPFTVEVRADGDSHTVNHAGAALLVQPADRVGLTGALSAGLAGVRQLRSAHDPGRVVRDLAVMLATNGGDALCDLRGLRDQPSLFGRVASDATAWRVIDAIAEHDLLHAIRAARARARRRAFAWGARPAGPMVIDTDATLVCAHSDKDQAAGTYKGGFGFHPLLAYLDGPGQAAGGQPLAGVLRSGNAGANNARDHIEVLDQALAQLPCDVAEHAEIVLRTDSAGATHELLDACREARIDFSVGFDRTAPVRGAILALPADDWTPALTQDQEPRDNGHVAEITGLLDPRGWPAGARVIVRRERPHPGAQLSFTDHDGYRFQAILTDQANGDIAAVERLHRARARVEDRIRIAKDAGLEDLPFRDFDANAVWLELVLAAQELLFYTQTLALTGELARAEPKRLRYRLLHTAARLAFHARKAVLRLPRSLPWAGQLAAAFARLAALPAP